MIGRRTRTSQMVRVWRNLAAQQQNWRCYWCNAKMLVRVAENHPDKLTADHVTPKHAGGRDTKENIVAACQRCNSTRTPRPLTSREKWKQDYRALRMSRRAQREREIVIVRSKEQAASPFAALAHLLVKL